MKDEKSYRILVIEDNPGDFILFDEFLSEQMAHSAIAHANDFMEAAAILSAHEVFDVILLDLTLPDKSGQQLIEEMLQLAAATPIIILTGFTDMDFSIKSISLGILDYLLKDDLNAVTLYKSVQYAIHRQRHISEIAASEKRYSELFHLSPQPMWVFDSDTSHFLDVNNAAINNYGYSREEFLHMYTSDIVANDVINDPADDEYNSLKDDALFLRNTVRHQKKNGKLMHVNLQSNPILFKSKKSVLILAIDITDRIKYIEAIEKQNKKLHEIAWVQSHKVRAPLARMLAIVNLIKELDIASPECEELLNHLTESGKELDTIIKDISTKTESININ